MHGQHDIVRNRDIVSEVEHKLVLGVVLIVYVFDDTDRIARSSRKSASFFLFRFFLLLIAILFSIPPALQNFINNRGNLLEMKRVG